MDRFEIVSRSCKFVDFTFVEVFVNQACCWSDA
jgi:hypothetical protein